MHISKSTNVYRISGRSTLLLPIVGLVAGFLTIYSMRFFGLPFPVGYDPLIGVSFGGLLGIYLWFFQNISPWKIVALAVASVVAYNLAAWSIAWVVLGAKVHAPGVITPDLFFFPGAVGAFTILTAVLFLVFPQARSWGALARTLAWSVLGGGLGMLGWWLGPAVGPVLGAALSSLRLNHVLQPGDLSEIAPFDYSVHVIWQAGMGVVLALALWSEQRIASRSPERAGKAPLKSLNIAVALFFIAAVVLAIGVYYDKWRTAHGTAACIAEEPPAENLPSQETISNDLNRTLIEGAIINRNIGAYVVGQMSGSRSSGQQQVPVGGKGMMRRLPPSINYFVPYERGGVTKFGTIDPTSFIRVVEYSNSDWARYELGNRPVFCVARLEPDTLKHMKKVTRFGQNVLRDEVSGGAAWDFYWTSENRLVQLHYSFSGADGGDELLEAYLKKYPSSVKP
jgi:hypothetical protein